jgi:hypothetical protein
MDEIDDPVFEARSSVYVLGKLVPKYQDYCPIALRWGYWRLNGTSEREHFLDDAGSIWLPNQVLDNPGFLVLQIGDWDQEITVDRAAKAIHGSLESLFAACGVRVDHELRRTPGELSAYMQYARDLYSHIILIGHGSPEGLKFRSTSNVEPEDETSDERLRRLNLVSMQRVVDLLGCDLGCRDVQIVSLCCYSGCDEFGSALSRAKNVTEVIAPSGTVDMRWAAHFVTNYFLRVFVNDKPVDEAVREAAVGCCGQPDENSAFVPMRLWRAGELVCDPFSGVHSELAPCLVGEATGASHPT